MSLKKISKNQEKKKLKKKWRFWREFKFFFLNNQKKKFFTRLKWICNQKRIIWHQISSMYGKKIKNLAYNTKKYKLTFNSRFFNLIIFLETRLNIVILRLGLCSKLLHANKHITNYKVHVNNRRKNENYIMKIGDILHFSILLTNFSIKKRFKNLLWRRFQWRNLKKNSQKNFINFFWISKQNVIINYFETNYKISSTIMIRKPLIGETLINNNKKLLTSNLLKKIYFLY
jgi:ribosomal protein S4